MKKFLFLLTCITSITFISEARSNRTSDRVVCHSAITPTSKFLHNQTTEAGDWRPGTITYYDVDWNWANDNPTWSWGTPNSTLILTYNDNGSLVTTDDGFSITTYDIYGNVVSSVNQYSRTYYTYDTVLHNIRTSRKEYSCYESGEWALQSQDSLIIIRDNAGKITESTEMSWNLWSGQATMEENGFKTTITYGADGKASDIRVYYISNEYDTPELSLLFTDIV